MSDATGTRCGPLMNGDNMEQSRPSGPAPLLTVLVPLYNGAGSMDLTVASVLKQDTSNLEVILIDDGSHDETGAKATAWGERDPRIRVTIHPRNLGLARTLNEGVRSARGDFVLILHQDSVLLGSTWISTALGHFSDPETAAVIGLPRHDVERMRPSEKCLWIIRAHLYASRPRETSKRPGLLFSENKCDVFRKASLSELGGFDESVGSGGEDQVLATRMRVKGLRVVSPPSLRFQLTLGGEFSVRRGLRRDLEYGRQMRSVLFRTRLRAVRGGKGTVWDPRLVNRTCGVAWLLVSVIAIVVAIATGTDVLLWVALFAALLRAAQLSFRALKVRRDYLLSAWQILAVAGLGLLVDVVYAAGWFVPFRNRKQPVAVEQGSVS